MKTDQNAVNEAALMTLDESTLTFEELEARLEMQSVNNPDVEIHFHVLG